LQYSAINTIEAFGRSVNESPKMVSDHSRAFRRWIASL
jgi:hypothetical protein